MSTDRTAHAAPRRLIGVESPNAPRPTGRTRDISDMLWRIAHNYEREGSGLGSRFEGRILEDVQAEAVTRFYLERHGV